jgi:putative ABC transport system permease protein
LTLAALYFRDSELDAIDFDESKRVTETGLATGIPLRVRHKAQTQPIVGTTIDYFAFRELKVARGRLFGMLGECVVGAEAAETLQADVGGDLFSSPSGAFDVAGSFPLKMEVVGVLEPAGTPDDQAVFVDIKTAWVIEGLAHGHDDLSAPEADDALLSREDGVAVASAAVLSYTEITPENIDSFHFHGDPGTFPIDAVVVAPKSSRSAVLLQGRYEEGKETVQAIAPRDVIERLLETMLSVRDYILLASLGVGVATLMIATLVFALSIQLRHREIETIRKLGGTRGRLIGILATEILLVLGASVALAAAMTAVVSHFSDAMVRFVAG